MSCALFYVMCLLAGVAYAGVGTKTPYHKRLKYCGWSDWAKLPEPSSWKPRFVYLLTRHGTRHPTAKRALELQKLVSLFKEAPASDEFAWMADWAVPYNNTQEALYLGQLHQTGVDEMRGLGSRFREQLPQLFGAAYVPGRYDVVSSQVSRASASASAFSQGLFSGNPPSPVAVTMSPKNCDQLLRFFDVCPSYQRFKANISKQLAEWRTAECAVMVKPLRKRLRLPDSAALDPGHIAALWTLCTVEQSVPGSASDACSLFTAQQRRILEWIDDVALYNVRGPANALNYGMATPLLRDVADSLVAAAGPASVRKARLMFGHAETLIPVLCALGIEGVEPSTGTQCHPRGNFTSRAPGKDAAALTFVEELLNTSGTRALTAAHSGLDVHQVNAKRCQGIVMLPEPSRQRRWEGSRVAPYSANIAFVLYKLEKASGASVEDFSVRVIVNEQVVPASVFVAAHDSDDSGLVPLPALLRVFTQACVDFDDVCAL